MLLPSIFGENLFDDWMDFSFPEICLLYTSDAADD